MLKISHLDLFYGDAQALFDVNFSMGAGELVALIGGNGAGKTSFIRTLCGIYAPKNGDISFEGTSLIGLESHSIAELGIGHVAEGRQIFPTLSIRDNLEVGGALKRSKARIPQNIDFVFSLFPKLSERQKQLAGTLSGGEQQMLAIGRCLMAEPRLICMDEPSLGLSPLMVQEMFRIIDQLHKMGLTILLVEQNVVHSLKVAERGYVLENGHITIQGSADDLLTNEAVKKAYLGM